MDFVDYFTQIMLNDIKKYLEDHNISNELKNKLISALFNQGLTHSSRRSPTSLLSDFYIRELQGRYNANASLLKYAMSRLHDLIKDKDSGLTYVPIISPLSQDSINNIITPLRKIDPEIKTEYHNITLSDGRTIYLVGIKGSDYAENNLAMALAYSLGHIGAIPTKDQLLAIISESLHKEATSSGSFDMDTFLYSFFEDRLLHNLPDDQMYDNIREYDEYKKGQTNSDLLAKIMKILQKDISIEESEGVNKARKFYFDLIKSFLNGLELEQHNNKAQSHEDAAKQELITLSLCRLLSKISYSNESTNFTDFMIGVEFAIDEINFILAMQQKYDTKSLAQVTHNAWNKLIGLDNVMAANNQHYGLTGSGMGAFRLLLDAAQKHFSSKNETLIKISSNSYFELPHAFQLDFDPQHDNVISIDGKGKKLANNKSKKPVDILITSFTNNIGAYSTAKMYHNVSAQIEEQFRLRKEQKNQSQLIVIIDYTMNNLSDPDMRDILNTYKKQIDNGELAILAFHSLNKNAAQGLDRSFSGATACFYNSSKFTNMQNLESIVEGFRVDKDVTPQSLGHLCATSFEYLDRFFNMLRDNTKDMYDLIRFPNDNDVKPIITIDNPYGADNKQILSNFIMIRVDSYKYILDKLEEFLKELGIYERDGYGYAETTWGVISSPKDARAGGLRISIGLDLDKEKIALIMTLITKINAAFADKNSNIRHSSAELNKVFQECLQSWHERTHKHNHLR
jgi:hypothetical protein